MNKLFKLGILFSVILLILTGCLEATGNSNTSESMIEEPKVKDVSIEKELILYPEDSVTNKKSYSKERYYFNGFIGADTISFTNTSEMGDVVVYQQAEIGLTFQLKYIETYELEITDFNRSKNYVKLKVKRVGEFKENEGEDVK